MRESRYLRLIEYCSKRFSWTKKISIAKYRLASAIAQDVWEEEDKPYVSHLEYSGKYNSARFWVDGLVY